MFASLVKKVKSNDTKLNTRVCGKITFFSQTAGNGFASGCVLSRTRPDTHTPKVGFEKSQKFVNFWIFPHPQYLNSV